MGFVALWHVRSSWTRDRTHVLFIVRQIPVHWAPTEVGHTASQGHSWDLNLGTDAPEPSGGLNVPFKVLLAGPSCGSSLHIVGAQETRAVSVSGDLDHPLHVS